MKAKASYKVCRRLGPGVYDKCQSQKYVVSEARHAKNFRAGRRRNISDYGKQLLEKQRIRFAYGIGERQLRKYVEEANRVAVLGIDPKELMIEQLEMRLDNVVYKLGFAPSRRSARQMVSHGHIQVNGTRTNIPSMQVQEDDVITVRERTKNLPIMERVKGSVEITNLPNWIVFNIKNFEGKITARPTLETTETPGAVAAILEYYSR